MFIALGGTGYAAFKLPKNSVGTKQLKKNAAKLKNGAVTLARVNPLRSLLILAPLWMSERFDWTLPLS